MSTIQFDSTIRGSVVVDQELYVITEGSCDVQVYDAVTSRFKSKFPVTGLSTPVGIAATNSLLFIYNRADGKIYRVEMPDKLVSSWTVGGELARLSITKTCNVLVALHESNALREYSQSGDLLRTIQLHTEMSGPRHVIHLDDDRFILTHNTYDGLHRVCLIDNRGRLIKSYGGNAGSGEGRLNNPRQLAVDRNGFIFVVCLDYNKCTLLNSNLEFVRYIIPASANINKFFTVFLDEYLGNLYVSDFAMNTLLVFKLD